MLIKIAINYLDIDYSQGYSKNSTIDIVGDIGLEPPTPELRMSGMGR